MSATSQDTESVECPTCGRDDFTSSQGMRQHHKESHGESLVDRPDPGGPECPTCGRTDYSTEHGMKIHHKKIHGESLSVEEFVCDHCGDDFEKETYLLNSGGDGMTFCSRECTIAFEKSKSEELTCPNCGDTVYRPPSRLNDHRSQGFCDQDCYAQWRSDHLTGERNPSWKGGGPHYYGDNWNQVSRKIRERDNHTCQRCGEEPGERKHDVHHIVPIRLFRQWSDEVDAVDLEDANVPRNLITLCHECNLNVDFSGAECPTPGSHWCSE